MAKSTQDLVIWLNKVAQQLEQDIMSIQIFTDKSFRVYLEGQEEPIYDSDDQDVAQDINDLPYEDPQDFSDFLNAVMRDTPDSKDPPEVKDPSEPPTPTGQVNSDA